jgi:hypothetical protein
MYERALQKELKRVYTQGFVQQAILMNAEILPRLPCLDFTPLSMQLWQLYRIAIRAVS